MGLGTGRFQSLYPSSLGHTGAKTMNATVTGSPPGNNVCLKGIGTSNTSDINVTALWLAFLWLQLLITDLFEEFFT